MNVDFKNVKVLRNSTNFVLASENTDLSFYRMLLLSSALCGSGNALRQFLVDPDQRDLTREDFAIIQQLRRNIINSVGAAADQLSINGTHVQAQTRSIN